MSLAMAISLLAALHWTANSTALKKGRNGAAERDAIALLGDLHVDSIEHSSRLTDPDKSAYTRSRRPHRGSAAEMPMVTMLTLGPPIGCSLLPMMQRPRRRLHRQVDSVHL